MKRTNTCTKCDGRELPYVPDSDSLRFSLLPVSRYICTGCGYAGSRVDK